MEEDEKIIQLRETTLRDSRNHEKLSKDDEYWRSRQDLEVARKLGLRSIRTEDLINSVKHSKEYYRDIRKKRSSRRLSDRFYCILEDGKIGGLLLPETQHQLEKTLVAVFEEFGELNVRITGPKKTREKLIDFCIYLVLESTIGSYAIIKILSFFPELDDHYVEIAKCLEKKGVARVRSYAEIDSHRGDLVTYCKSDPQKASSLLPAHFLAEKFLYAQKTHRCADWLWAVCFYYIESFKHRIFCFDDRCVHLRKRAFCKELGISRTTFDKRWNELIAYMNSINPHVHVGSS